MPAISVDARTGDAAATEEVLVKRIRALASAVDLQRVDGQSKIANWTYNQLLAGLRADYERFRELGRIIDAGGDLGDEADELRRERWALFGRLFSQYGVRDRVPGLKEAHPFLRLVHSSPLKNAALRLQAAFGQWRKRRGTGYGFPGFRSWSRNFMSLEYDERKGWSARGRGLRLSFGERVVPEAEMTPAQANALVKRRKSDPDAVLKERIGVDLRLAEPAPTDAYRIEVVKEGGELFVVFTRKVARKPPVAAKAGRIIYLDPNHKNLAYGLSSSGQAFEIANREGIKDQNRTTDRLQGRRDRAERRQRLVEFHREDGTAHRHWRPSNAWHRRNRALLRIRAKGRGQNKTFVHTVLHRLCDDHDAIGLGDYTPDARDHRLGRTARVRRKANRGINNRSLLGRLQSALPRVAAKRGRLAFVMDETGTTRTCHLCGHVVQGGIHPGIRAWVCPGCGARHIRDENACQNGLRRLDALLGAQGRRGNPQSHAQGSDGGPCSAPRARPGVGVACRCDWTFDQRWSCRVVETPRETVAALLASARHVGAAADRVQKKPRGGAAAPDRASQAALCAAQARA